MTKRTQRELRAKYVLAYWDREWNEIDSPEYLHTADEMFKCIERWNVEQQKASKHHPDGVVCDHIPAFITIEVRYVEA